MYALSYFQDISEDGRYWSNVLYALIKGKPLYTGTTINNYIGFCSHGNRKEIGTFMHCPAQRRPRPDYPVSYGMSQWLGGSDFRGDIATLPPPKLNCIQLPGKAMVVLEGGNQLLRMAYVWRPRVYPELLASGGVHSNGVNVLYVDGHAKGMKNIQVPTEAGSAKGLAFWKGLRL